MRKTLRHRCSGSASKTYMPHSALFRTKPRLMCKYLFAIKVRSLLRSSNSSKTENGTSSSLCPSMASRSHESDTSRLTRSVKMRT